MFVIVSKTHHVMGHGESGYFYTLSGPAYKELECYPAFRTKEGAEKFLDSISKWARQYNTILEMEVRD